MCVYVCVCVCLCVSVCVCVAKPVAVELRCHVIALIFSFMDSFVFKQQVLFRVVFLSVTLDHRVQCPRVGKGSKSRNLKKYIFFLLLFFSYVVNHI